MNAAPTPTPSDIEGDIWYADIIDNVISTHDDFVVTIEWELRDVDRVVEGAVWMVNSSLESLTSAPDISLQTLDVPIMPGSGPIYRIKLTIPSGVVPAGTYKLFTIITYVDEQGKPLPIAGFAESAILQFFDPFSNNEVNESEFTFITRARQKVTPYYLAKTISPFLIAIADIQRIIDDIQFRSHREVVIKSITQHTPISINLEGAAEAMKTIRDFIVPWRRNHEIKMASLEEQEKQMEIESKKAEILEMRASATKDRAKASRLNAEVSKQHEEVETIRLGNQKLQLELYREKIQLGNDVLEQLAPNLSETQRIGYLVKLLPAIDELISNEIILQPRNQHSFQR